MKIFQSASLVIATFVIPICLSGCTVIGDIFKAGVFVGVVVVIVVIALIVFIFRKMSK